MLRLALITQGEPTRLTGGYLYHLRLAELAPRFGARIEFECFPDWRFPFPMLKADDILTRAANYDAILLDSIAAAYLWHRPLPRPTVAILHQPPGGIDHGWWRTRLQAWMDRRTYQRCARLLVASADLLGVVPSAKVAAPGCDVAAGASAPETSAANPDLRQGRKAAFLCVGNWVERKDILSLLEAFAPLQHLATLHLVGDEKAEPAYGGMVERHLQGLQGVQRHGKKSRAEVAKLYRAADAFVLPSRREPYGTVYGEAMAAGLPVVGWNAGNLPNLATHEKEGLIVPTGDVTQLTAAMRRLAEHPELREQLGRAARRKAQQFPTWEETTRLILETVREALQTGAR